MKIVFGVFLCFLVSSCNVNNNQQDIALKKDAVMVKHVGKNLVNEAEYYIFISCYKKDSSHEQIKLIPDDQSIEVYVDYTCNNEQIDTKVFDTLTQKKFHTALWYRGVSDISDTKAQLYKFQNSEIQKIANAPWKYLELEGLSDEQYPILRNTHNSIHEGFGLGTKYKIYSQSERDICEAPFQNIKDSQDKELWSQVRKKVESCYKNLPQPLDTGSPKASLKTPSETWNQDTTFINCSSSDVPKNLEEAVGRLADSSSISGGVWGKVHFGRFVTEHCVTQDGDMIFYSQDKAPTTFGRYNSKQDILEPASFDPQFLPFIYFFDGKKYGFGKRAEEIIPLISAKMDYKHFERNFLKTPFQNEKNEKFCKNGLTGTEKPSECFIEIYYEYDFVNNIVSEKKVCTYWKNTTDSIVPMEKCMLAK